MVTYSAQARLASQYSELIQSTADFLRSNSYYGPAGINIMTDMAGVHDIVDLNPHSTGSFVPGCLRPHFLGVPGMIAACTLPFVEFFANRATREKAFPQKNKKHARLWCLLGILI